ncbi:hypothetical protein [Sinomicrobium weinanense]|uniref:Uncharacterized protein n=1 Tax=Sinomicrobium weinanense TaxID=2842200 RepID=A0A926JUY0_9FLAO|nr:hypothetical protein [Sinomicrobium weinanense]MBC9798028.1 hypothetical protein [Sinomicrobium weinanense]MBU3125861.1 hypothetical protein [Sinomicrobium weinanense]
MKNRRFLLLLFYLLAISACDDSSFKSDPGEIGDPANLNYVSITDARESRNIATIPPTVQTGGLTPEFELVSIRKEDGTLLDESYLQYVSIGESSSVEFEVDPEEGKVDENGNPLESVNATNSASNGIISIAGGHNFTVGDYYFTIKVSTEAKGVEYSTVFEDAFHLYIAPLLPGSLIYSPKNQNLVYGDPESKTSAPLLPNANPDVTFELGDHTDKLAINGETGEISLAPDFTYSVYDTLSPTVRVVSNISNEVTVFEDKITTIITDTPQEMPVETVYPFYPTLKTSGSFPTGGEGFSVQVVVPGNGEDIWGVVDNSAGRFLETPEERPGENTSQTVLETQTFAGGVTHPATSWMVTGTQDLTLFQYGYDLSFNYYYQPAYQTYMEDGRTPTDLEVYISTDYTGGDIQDKEGNWLNGTWIRVNESIRCRRSEGVTDGKSSGPPWGPEFIGTPYPGNQEGPDPDGRKTPGTTFYGKWVKCSFDIPSELISRNFTVAFKVASYFEGELLNNAEVPGRGGTYFLSDFNYRADESTD